MYFSHSYVLQPMLCTSATVKYFSHCSSNVILLKDDNNGVTCSMHAREVFVGFWFENMKERDLMEVFGIVCMILLKWILKYRLGVDSNEL